MRSKVYISLAGCFFIASVIVYAITFAYFNTIGDNFYYNMACLYKLLFAWGFTYLTFEVEQVNKNVIQAWALKWSSIYVTGFLLVRMIFNIMVDSVVTKFELGVLAAGLVVTFVLAIKSWRNGR